MRESELARILSSTRGLLSDLRSVLSESRLTIDHRFTVAFSLDASEFFDYVFPYKGDNNLEFGFQLSNDRTKAFTDYCLEEILLHRPISRVSTSSQRTELLSLYEQVQMHLYTWDNYKDLDELYERALRETDAFKLSEDSNEVYLKEEDGLKRLTDDELELSLQRLAPTLFLLVVKEDLMPGRRRAILSEKFSASQIEQFSGAFNRDLYKHFRELLDDERPGRRSQNEFDAMSLEQVVSANARGCKRRKFFKIVTRDKAVSAASLRFLDGLGYQEFFPDLDLDHIARTSLIRHPRSFLWLMMTPGARHKSYDALMNLRQSLTKHEDECVELLDSKRRGETPWRNYGDSVIEIRNQILAKEWLKTIEKSIANDLLGEGRRPAIKQEFIQILGEIADRRKVTSRLQVAASQVANDIIYGQSVIDHQISIEQSSQRSQTSIHEASNSAVVEVEKPFFPYSFKFRDSYFLGRNLGKEIERLDPSSSSEFDQVVEQYVHIKNASRFEQRLSMAVQSAARMNWDRALLLCQQAVDLPSTKKLPRNDGWYLRAVLTRRSATDISGLEEALSYIQNAIEPSKTTERRYSKDPRFYRERAACSCDLVVRMALNKNDHIRRVGLTKQMFSDIDEAINLYEDDKIGVLHCLRIAGSYYFDFDRIHNKRDGRKICRRLYDLVSTFEGSNSELTVRFWHIYLRICEYFKWTPVGKTKIYSFLAAQDYSRNAPKKELDIYKDSLSNWLGPKFPIPDVDFEA